MFGTVGLVLTIKLLRRGQNRITDRTPYESSRLVQWLYRHCIAVCWVRDEVLQDHSQGVSRASNIDSRCVPSDGSLPPRAVLAINQSEFESNQCLPITCQIRSDCLELRVCR
jgi:hypothetical protein